MFSFCQCSQSVSAVDTFPRLPSMVTESGRQSTATMSFSAHPCKTLPGALPSVSCKLVSGHNTNVVHVVSFDLSPPNIVMRMITEGSIFISASRISTVLWLGPGWSQGDLKLSRHRMHSLDPKVNRIRLLMSCIALIKSLSVVKLVLNHFTHFFLLQFTFIFTVEE